MKNLKIFFIFFILFASALPARPSPDDFAKNFKYCLLSVRKLTLNPGEKITGYKLNLNDAYVYAAPIVPEDWSLDIGNNAHREEAWACTVSAKESHGTGWVPADYFRNFIVIGIFKPSADRPDFIPHFDMELEITVELDLAERKMLLRPKDMVFKPYPASLAY